MSWDARMPRPSEWIIKNNKNKERNVSIERILVMTMKKYCRILSQWKKSWQ